jgi:large subunit ribosomal protein L25
MAILKLSADLRENSGTRSSRALRESGYIPASLYSHGKPASLLKLNSMQWSKALENELHLVMLEMPGEKPQTATVREIQRDPISQDIIHIDLLKIQMDETINFSVKIEFIGIPKGAKDGGVTQVVAGHIEVECLPADVPDSLSIDISKMELGNSLHARDLVIPENVKLITDPDHTLVSVAAVRIAVKEEAVVAEVEGAEGEVAAAGAAGKKEAVPGKKDAAPAKKEAAPSKK